MGLKEKFDALEASEQWPFVLSLSKEEKDKLEIGLDYDTSWIDFDPSDVSCNEDGEVDDRLQLTEFKEHFGCSDGSFSLLKALGFNVEFV